MINTKSNLQKKTIDLINDLDSYQHKINTTYKKKQRDFDSAIKFNTNQKIKLDLDEYSDNNQKTLQQLVKLKVMAAERKLKTSQKLLKEKQKRIQQLIQELKQNQNLVTTTIGKWKDLKLSKQSAVNQNDLEEINKNLSKLKKRKEQLQSQNDSIQKMIKFEQQEHKLKVQLNNETIKTIKRKRNSEKIEWKQIFNDINLQLQRLKKLINQKEQESSN